MSSLIQMWIMLLLVLVILGGVMFLLRKSKYIKNLDSDMKVIGRLAVGPRSYLAKVKVGDKTILLGITSQNISYLCDLSSQDEHINVEKFKNELASNSDFTQK